MKLHPYFLLLLIYFALKSSVPGIDFFLRKRSLLYLFFLVVLLRNPQILELAEKTTLWKNNLRAYRVGFAAFSHAMGS